MAELIILRFEKILCYTDLKILAMHRVSSTIVSGIWQHLSFVPVPKLQLLSNGDRDSNNGFYENLEKSIDNFPIVNASSESNAGGNLSPVMFL